MEQERLTIKEKIKQHLWQKDRKRSLRLGVGCAYIGKGEADKITDLAGELKLLLTVYEKGFRYFDTSADYQGGRSEMVLGEFIKQIPRHTIFLATKSDYKWQHDQDPFNEFYDNFFRSFERLQVDYIDLFQIHDTEHFGCCESEVIPFLLEQQKKGLIGYIGTGMRSLNAHEMAVRSGHVQSVLSYQNYSLLSRAALPLIKLCREKSCAFINASVLHHGMIKHPEPKKYFPARRHRGFSSSLWQRWQDDTDNIQKICQKAGVNILAPALQYSLMQPDIDITLNGIHRLSNLESTIEAVEAVIHPEVWAEISRQQDKNPYMDVQDDLLY